MQTNRNSTRRSLLVSATALILSIAMLVGTTFAWFTDTASTGVNKIQAGNLNIELQMKDNDDNWVNAEGKILPFLVEGKIPADGTQILWEPGCTYYVPQIRVLNKGNLAVKIEYIPEALGVTGKLAEVLEPVFKTPVDADGEEVNIEPKILKPGETSPAWSFGYHMDENAGNEYQNATASGMYLTVVATQATYEKDSKDDQYDKDAEYPTITTGATLNEVFADASIDFGYGNTSTESVTLDGKGVAVVSDWTDAWVNSDTTIKGVTFRNGAVFSAKTDNVTITLENCTFYACDQSKLTYTGNNSLTNSGAGMCLNLEKSSHSGVKFIVKNCTFVGENDKTLPVDGPRYNGDGTINGTKKRGHAIALDAICGGGTGTLDSLLIEGCVINGVRGNAIQLYGNTGDITIKDTQINSWAMNNSRVGFAIRGDYPASGRTLTIQNVYFGLDEQSDNSDFGHVKVGSFSGNTDGTEMAGTYSK